jgi:hypothetical protein
VVVATAEVAGAVVVVVGSGGTAAPVVIAFAVAGGARGADHSITAIRIAIDGKDHKTGTNQVIYAVTGSETVATYGEAGLDVALLAYDIKDGIKSFRNLRKLGKLNDVVPSSGGKSVLGSHPDYLDLADDLGAKRFSIPTEIWNKMTPAQRWAANQKFLDRMSARGDDIILSNSEGVLKLT